METKSVTISQTQFLAEIADPLAPIPQGKLAYFETRVRHAFYDYVISKFREKEKEGLTKAALARRIGRDAALVNRYLATPNNWTIDTATILLLGIAAEELQPSSTPVAGRAPQNFDPYIAADQPFASAAPTTFRHGATLGRSGSWLNPKTSASVLDQSLSAS
jgi:hypothetical protein